MQTWEKSAEVLRDGGGRPSAPAGLLPRATSAHAIWKAAAFVLALLGFTALGYFSGSPAGRAARAGELPVVDPAGELRGASNAASSGEALRAAVPTPLPVSAPVTLAPPAPSHEGAPPAPSDGTAGEALAGLLPDGRVALNAATADALERLPGVGPSRAAAILALRRRLGRFRLLEDLLRVKGIGRKTLAKIAPKVVLDAPTADAK